MTVNSIRRLAKRRGYTLHKKYGKDRFYLIDSDGQTIVARETDGDGKYFTQEEVIEYLKWETPLSERDDPEVPEPTEEVVEN